MTDTPNFPNYAAFGPDQVDWLQSSRLIKDPAVWNLAVLSWDFSKGRHPDPNFTVLLHKTVHMDLETGEFTVPGVLPEAALLRSWLSLPPPGFYERLKHWAWLPLVPLLQAYGKPWVTQLVYSCRMWKDPSAPPELPLDLTAAKTLLSKF